LREPTHTQKSLEMRKGTHLWVENGLAFFLISGK
jgi:hypothetical protein